MDKKTEPVGDDVAATLENFFLHIYSGEEIIAKLQEYECPTDCDTLKPLQINEEVKHAMHKADKTEDFHMCYMCNALPKAAQALATLWAQLIDAKCIVQNEQSLT